MIAVERKLGRAPVVTILDRGAAAMTSSPQRPAPDIAPRIIRFRDAPRYLGMDRNRFNAEVRPYLTEVPIGKQGIGFDRLELDAWFEDYKSRNGRPARKGDNHMGRKTIPGLIMRAGVWHVDKRICGRRVCQSTGTADLQEAERYLARLMEQTRQAQVYGVRPSRTFEQAAAKFVLENQHKRSIGDDVMHAEGSDAVDRSHAARPDPHRQPAALDRTSGEQGGKAVGTINHGLQVVRRILNLAAGEWVDEHGLTWLQAPPKIKLLPDSRQAPALSAELGRADARCSRSCQTHLARDGAVRGQHRLPRPGDLRPALGVGSRGA